MCLMRTGTSWGERQDEVPREPAAGPAGLLTPGSLGRLRPAGLRGLGEDAGGGQQRWGDDARPH